MRVLVLGLGVTGESVVAWAAAAGHDVVVVEDDPSGDPYARRAARAAAVGAVLLAGAPAAEVEACARSVDLVVPSPGVRPNHPVILAATGAGVTVRSEVDVGVEQILAMAPRPRLIAVTGTNGKTTVTTMAAAMCAESGLAALTVGNIGRPVIELARDVVDGGTAADVVVMEVSSFQLEFTTAAFVPDVAVLLNVASDHIDWHDSVEAYAKAKARVFAHQTPGHVLVVNADDPIAWELSASAAATVVPYSGRSVPARGYGVRGGMLVGPQGDVAAVPASTAVRDVENALAATAAVVHCGADVEGVARALASWQGLPHRLQLVATVDGVRYVDDSKATNGHAAANALRGLEHAVLIAGGRDRSRDLGRLRGFADRLRAVVAIGEAAETVVELFEGLVPVERAASMRDAVRAAAARAVPGDTVLLSPGCASLDMYESYAARGDDFAREVRLLPGENA